MTHGPVNQILLFFSDSPLLVFSFYVLLFVENATRKKEETQMKLAASGKEKPHSQPLSCFTQTSSSH
jgi:hypothetical protein